MLIGNNQLKFNEATLMAIVQEYLNGRLIDRDDHVKVTAFKHTVDGLTTWFAVNVEPKPQGVK